MNLLKKFSKKKNEKSSIIKTGLKKLMYWICYPFKLWWVWLLILIVGFLAPTFNGVKPAEVHLWYWGKVRSAVSNVTSSISEKTDSLIKKVDISNSFSSGKENVKLQMPEQAVVPSRKAFAKADSAPQAVDIMKREENVPQGVVPILSGTAEVRVMPSVSTDGSLNSIGGYRRDVPSLVYLENPRDISGISFVYHANAIDVNGVYVMLFGVYADPQTEKVVNAALFLEKLIENKNVSCKIVAFTAQNVPTGICFIDNMNINKLLVLKGLSENVALY